MKDLSLGPGASGDAVRDLQRRLTTAGHDCSADAVGQYGPATEAAVRAFQELRGQRVDGVCGDQTWSSLVESGYRLGDRLIYLRSPMLRGDDIADLQRCLGLMGFDAGRVDGILGPMTAEAIADFQRNAGLTTDGICGPATVEAVRRFRSRSATAGSTVAGLREVENLRAAPPHLAGRRIVVAESGGAAALADALGRSLRDAGAAVTVVHHPDDSEKAAAANGFEAAVFVGLVLRERAGVSVAYYAHDGFESAGGRRLAELTLEELPVDVLGPAVGARGMRVAALRETRMPAVLVELGPPAAVVEHAPMLVTALARAVAVLGVWTGHLTTTERLPQGCPPAVEGAV